MDLCLKRQAFQSWGIVSKLRGDSAELDLWALEHAYPSGAAFHPKIPCGIYVCVRGIHQLASGESLPTFEISGVPGHAGILFHPGNYNADSEGCVLLGMGVDYDEKMLLFSRIAFDSFMTAQCGVTTFQLTVS